MTTRMLTKREHEAPAPSAQDAATERVEVAAAISGHRRRRRRLKIHVAAWALGAIVITGFWVLNQWQANGSFQHFGSHAGNPGDWNPTLWALAVGGWGLVVGIMALRVRFERPPTEAEVDRELERPERRVPARSDSSDAELRHFVRRRLSGVGRLKFHVAAWVLGMIVLTPLWALIEWQDNGGLERFSGDGRPGSWELWILPVAGIWALVVAALALQTYVVAVRGTPKPGARAGA